MTTRIIRMNFCNFLVLTHCSSYWLDKKVSAHLLPYNRNVVIFPISPGVHAGII
jgi:hypothetical protein